MNFIRSLFLILLCTATCMASSIWSSDKNYQKQYFSNGTLKAEGWVLNTSKNGYWKFYHPNGKVASEGHFKHNQKEGYWFFYNEQQNVLKEGHYVFGKAEKWWIFYDIAQQKMKKIQFQNNQKNGFALCYTMNKLKKAEKYSNGQKVDEWTSMIAFKIDNPTISLK